MFQTLLQGIPKITESQAQALYVNFGEPYWACQPMSRLGVSKKPPTSFNYWMHEVLIYVLYRACCCPFRVLILVYYNEVGFRNSYIRQLRSLIFAHILLFIDFRVKSVGFSLCLKRKAQG